MDDRIAMWVKYIEKMVANGMDAYRAVEKIRIAFGLSDDQVRLVKNWYMALVTS